MRMNRKGDGHTMGGEGGILVAPGKTGLLSYQFNTTGTMLIGRHEPEHFAAGMVIKVTVR